MKRPCVIASIVEGHGDALAVPILIRRIAAEIYDLYDVQIKPPHRVPRATMKGEQLRKAIQLQGDRVADTGGVIVITDADDDCPVDLAGQVISCAQHVHVEVAIAVREFEAWFLSAVESLRPHRAVRDDGSYQGDPEAPRDAKGHLQHLMTEPYRETRHQPAFASLMDLASARRARSFDRLVTCVGRLLHAVGRSSV